jgi:ActR/RegA family two-component response regulator
MAIQALIACGEDSLVQSLADKFGELGLQVECTGETHHASSLLGRGMFQLVVVDCDSQGGLELVEFVRRQRATRQTVLLALVSSLDAARLACNLGADFILNKPLDAEMTRKTLRAAHTMTIRESRSGIRERVHSPATVSVGDLQFVGAVVDVSESGIGLECAQLIEIGKQLQIEFSLPGCDRAVRCTGKVVRVEPGRLGIHFLYLSAASAEVVMMWLRAHSPRHCAARA